MRGATMGYLMAGSIKFISIHAPHAGRDKTVIDSVFDDLHFNPRAPCGARRPPGCWPTSKITISIHAPHAGRDRDKL